MAIENKCTPKFYGGGNWTFVSYFGMLGWLPPGAICLWLIKSGQFEKAAA